MKQISKNMLKSYVGIIVNSWIIDNGIPAIIPDKYVRYVDELEESLRAYSDMDAFQIGIDYLLEHPEVDITFLDGSEYVWEDDELRPLLSYIREKFWLNSDLKSEHVELVNMPIHEWRKSQNEENLSGTIT
jgi:frataxin-like iron-binding protein CyaY